MSLEVGLGTGTGGTTGRPSFQEGRLGSSQHDQRQ